MLTFDACCRLQEAVAHIDAARAVRSEYRAPAASADMERRAEETALTIAATPVTAMTMAAAVHAVPTAMSATMPTAVTG